MIGHEMANAAEPRPGAVAAVRSKPDIREEDGMSEALRFGAFVVLPSARTLMFKGDPVPLGSRAFDLLVLLLRRRGTIVSKDEIVSYVWPSLFVEESNLRFQMAALRRALGPARHLIKTIPGRGYIFAADVGARSLASPARSHAAALALGPEAAASSAVRVAEGAISLPVETRVLIAIDQQWNLRETLQAVLDALARTGDGREGDGKGRTPTILRGH